MLFDKNIIKFLTITSLIAFVTSKIFNILIKTVPKLMLRVNPEIACSFLAFFYYRASAWLFLCGDIELNPAPPPNDYLKFMHWNANSLPAHNFARIPLIQLYNAINDFSLIAISETALKTEIPNEKIEIPGYCPIRCDLANNDSHGGVMIYHKENMAVKNRSDLFDHINSLVLELSIAKKKFFSYWSTENMARHLLSLTILSKNSIPSFLKSKMNGPIAPSSQVISMLIATSGAKVTKLTPMGPLYKTYSMTMAFSKWFTNQLLSQK